MQAWPNLSLEVSNLYFFLLNNKRLFIFILYTLNSERYQSVQNLSIILILDSHSK